MTDSTWIRKFPLLLLIGGVLVAGCQQAQNTSEADPTSLADDIQQNVQEPTPEWMSSIPYRVEQLLKRTRDNSTLQMVEVRLGVTQSIRIPQHEKQMIPDSTVWVRTADLSIPMTGKVVATFQSESKLPKEIAWDATNRLITLESGQLISYDSKATRSSLELPEQIRKFQLDSTLQNALVSWESEAQEVELNSGRILRNWKWDKPGGYAVYHPTKRDKWIRLIPHTNLDANAKLRVIWSATLYDSPSGESTMLFDSKPFSQLGTLPSLELGWGVDYELGKLLPQTAPLQRWTPEKGTLDTFLTLPASEIDYSPAVAFERSILFLRSESPSQDLRRITTRAWSVPIDQPSQASQITTEPTLQIAGTPSSDSIAALLYRGNESWQLVQYGLNELDSNAIDRQQIAFAELKKKIQQLQDAWDQSYLSLFVQDKIPNQMEDRLRISTKVRTQMNEIFKIKLDGTAGDLKQLDSLMDYSEGYWRETPVTIWILGILYGELLSEMTDTTWGETEVSNQLGRETIQFSTRPNWGHMQSRMIYLGLEDQPAPFDFHHPFHVVRERIAGRMQFSEAARNALEYSAYPTVLMTQELSQDLSEFVQRLGAEKDPSELTKNLKNLEYATVGFESSDYDVAIAGSLAVAETNPYTGENLLRLAKALQYSDFTTETTNLLNLAMEFPLEGDHLLGAVDIWIQLGDFERAESILESLEQSEEAGYWLSEQERFRRLIHDLRDLELQETQP
jgi:hypothetical protein